MKCYPTSNCKMLQSLDEDEDYLSQCDVDGDCGDGYGCCHLGKCGSKIKCFLSLEFPIILAGVLGLCIALCCFLLVCVVIGAKVAKEKADKKREEVYTEKQNKVRPEIIKYKLIQHKSKKVPIPAIEGLIKEEAP